MTLTVTLVTLTVTLVDRAKQPRFELVVTVVTQVPSRSLPNQVKRCVRDLYVASRRRCEREGHVDEEPAAGFGHGSRRRHLPKGQPEWPHGVGHHLLMPD